VTNIKDCHTCPDGPGRCARQLPAPPGGQGPAADMTGGTGTITNVGVFGNRRRDPNLTAGGGDRCIWPGQRDAGVHEGELGSAQVTTLSLSFDQGSWTADPRVGGPARRRRVLTDRSRTAEPGADGPGTQQRDGDVPPRGAVHLDAERGPRRKSTRSRRTSQAAALDRRDPPVHGRADDGLNPATENSRWWTNSTDAES